MCLSSLNAIIKVMQGDLIQLKVNNLIALLSTFVIVTVSGTIGMLFTPHCFLKYFLLLIGGFYSCLFISNLSNTIKELNSILYKTRKEK